MPFFAHENRKAEVVYLARIIKPHKRWFLLASSLVFAAAGAQLFHVHITQSLIDSVPSGSLPLILQNAASFLLVIALSAAIACVSGISIARFSAGASRDMKRSIAESLLHIRYGEIISLKAGDLLASVNSDTKIVSDFLGGDLITFFSQFIMMIVAFIYLVCIDPLLAVITFAYTPFGMCFSLQMNRKMNRLYPIRADQAGEALSLVEQVLSQIPVIKSFLMEGRLREKVKRHYQDIYQTDMRIALPNALLQTACGSTANMPRILFILYAGGMVMRGEMTLGAFVAVFDLLFFILGPTAVIPFTLNSLNQTFASIRRIRRIERLPRSTHPKENDSGAVPSICLRNVSFRYADAPVLDNLSFFHSGPGIIAIRGKSGAGKTTLLDLIAGLYEPDAGQIETTGQISVVTQDSYLFADTVIDNVRFGRLSASGDEIAKAMSDAGIDDFAHSLPNGVGTILGDGNCALSGGQKQRVSLARTFLSDASIWLFDEPTSALDEETERHIIDAITSMRGKKLILLTTHRSSLMRIADTVIDLDGRCAR